MPSSISHLQVLNTSFCLTSNWVRIWSSCAFFAILQFCSAVRPSPSFALPTACRKLKLELEQLEDRAKVRMKSPSPSQAEFMINSQSYVRAFGSYSAASHGSAEVEVEAEAEAGGHFRIPSSYGNRRRAVFSTNFDVLFRCCFLHHDHDGFIVRAGCTQAVT
jgi:hypothetical protein